MANKPRFISVLPEIIKAFTKTGKNVFSTSDISEIFEVNKDRWRLPLYMDLNIFMDQLAAQTFVKEVSIDFPEVTTARLFYFNNASVYEIACGLFPKGYLSHYSALSIWGLTEQIPKSIYITVEQSNSPAKSLKPELEQKNIDAAFRKPQRQSETVSQFGNFKLVLLRGKHTKNLGVGVTSDSDNIMVTDLERTLIDIVVRPAYSGGVSEVLKAFRNANGLHKISVNKLSSYLNKINFIYPYHQVIGFYLEAAGYKKSQVDIFAGRNKEFDFYLAYDMRDMDYSQKWRIYYPKGLI